MRERLGMHRYNLTVQMVLSFVLLVLLTAVTAGVPAVILIRQEIEEQAWSQVEQGAQTSQALYQAWQGKVHDMAVLTAQRPTLHTLAQNGDLAGLQNYLQTLRQGTEMDVILVCDSLGQPVAQVGDSEIGNFCTAVGESSFQKPAATSQQLWLVAGERVGELGGVVVGVQVDANFAREMGRQTGLVHSYVWQDVPLSSGLQGGTAAWQPDAHHPVSKEAERVRFVSDGRTYYARQIPLGPLGLVDEIALDVTDRLAAQRQLIWTLVGSISLAALIASGVGIFMARRIGQPLNQLAQAASHIRAGHLDVPLDVPSKVRDVTEVTQALEGARVALHQMIQQLQQANAWTDNLLESIVEGIVTIDRHGRITFFSPGAERITGLRQSEILGDNCNHVLHPAGTDEPFSQFIPPPGKARKVALRLHDQRQITVSFTGARLAPPGAGEAGVALVFRDVSESDQIHRLLGQFLANVTHEFRTPLSAVAASVELLRDQAEMLPPDELRQLLNSLHLGIVGLQTLVDNLLESASLEVGRFRIYPRPTDLGEIIGEAANLLQPLLDKYDQRLLVELSVQVPVVQADPRRMVQVLVNLFSNAIKYSPEGADLQICVARQEQRVQVQVADRGPGVPTGYRPELFRRFARSETADAKAQYGAGLGLYVVRAIVESHGGEVGVADRPGGGSIFWFTLPVAVQNGQD